MKNVGFKGGVYVYLDVFISKLFTNNMFEGIHVIPIIYKPMYSCYNYQDSEIFLFMVEWNYVSWRVAEKQ